MTTRSKADDGGVNDFQGLHGDAVSADSSSADILGILNAVDLPIVVVGSALNITSFNRQAREVLFLTASDIGKSVRHIRALAEAKKLEELCAQVITDGIPRHCDVGDKDLLFLVRIVPCSGNDGQIGSAVLTFTNITTLHARLAQAIYERESTKAILNAIAAPLVVLDFDLRIQTANQAFYALFQVSRDEALGIPLYDLGNRNRDTLWLATLLKEKLSENSEFQALEVEYDFPAIGHRTVLLDAGRLSREGTADLFLLTFHDVTERKRAEQARATLAAIVQSSDDAIVSKDLNGIIQSWNRGAERIFGYTEQEAIGQPITMLIPSDRLDEEPVILERIRRGEHIKDYETVRRRKDGTSLHISLTVSSIIDRNGKIVGASKIARDITERKRTEEELQRLLASEHLARLEAEAANHAKDDFLAIVSHELRTPLTPILMWSRMLNAESDPKEIPLAMEMIERNVKLQLRLIEDLLDLNRAARGKMALKLTDEDVYLILRSAVENLRKEAQTKHITLRFAEGNEALWVHADAGRLQQVFVNILCNALKFTPPGGTVQVNLGRQADSAILSFRDTGEGIAPEFLPHVFEMFRQQEESRQRSHSGLGIGLTIAKHLVELHGGTIEVKSEGPGLGTAVTISLPSLASSNEVNCPVVPTALSRLSSALQGLSILLVEDSVDSRAATEFMLKQLNAHVSSATNGLEALNLMTTANPDLVLCDLAMPGMDGFKFIKELRRIRGSVHPPVIAVSGFATDADHERTRAAGFAGQLDKPFDEISLLSAIKSAQRQTKA